MPEGDTRTVVDLLDDGEERLVQPRQGIDNDQDNCPSVANASQSDENGNGRGDKCDILTDADFDGVMNSEDNCPLEYNPGQTNICGAYQPPGPPPTCNYNANSGYDMLMLMLLACGVFYGRSNWMGRRLD